MKHELRIACFSLLFGITLGVMAMTSIRLSHSQGVKPADLPVVQANKFELVVNASTALPAGHGCESQETWRGGAEQVARLGWGHLAAPRRLLYMAAAQVL